MVKKGLTILMMGLCCLMLAGCPGGGDDGEKKDKKDKKAPPVSTIVVEPFKPEEPIAINESVQADVYLDATPSMLGYINSANNTVYINAVRNIEQTLKNNWNTSDISFIRFGEKCSKISRDQFLAFDKPGFYNENNTILGNAVSAMNKDKLSILVSDMFETGPDGQNFGYKLNEKFFVDANKAVAIIGLKSQFEGTIYDVGRNANAVTGVKSNRPFYLIVAGQQNDVRNFVKNYKVSGQEAKVALFSKNIGGPYHFETNKNKTKESLPSMSKSGEFYQLKTGEKISKVALSFQADNVLSDVPKSYNLGVDSLEVFTKDKAPEKNDGGVLDKAKNMMNNNKKVTGSYQKVETVSALASGTVQGVQKKASIVTAYVDLKLAPAAFNKKTGKYKLDLSLVPTQEEYVNSVVNPFEEWNFADDKTPSKEEIGNKTQNITNIIKQVAEGFYKKQKPGFHNAVIYFEAK